MCPNKGKFQSPEPPSLSQFIESNQPKTIPMPKRHILGWPISGPYKVIPPSFTNANVSQKASKIPVLGACFSSAVLKITSLKFLINRCQVNITERTGVERNDKQRHWLK